MSGNPLLFYILLSRSLYRGVTAATSIAIRQNRQPADNVISRKSLPVRKTAVSALV